MSETFKAAVWRGGDKLQTEALILRDLAPTDVVVHVLAANICMTDYISLGPVLSSWGDPLPQVLGHAAVGRVEAVGSAVNRVAVGDRVVATSTPQCGECRYCLRGKAYQCAASKLVGPSFATNDAGEDFYASSYVGGFAEVAVVPQIQLTVVDTTLSDAELALLADTYGSGIGAALLTAPIEKGAVAVAVGLGVSGLAYVQGAKLSGAQTIIGIDPRPERREMALRSGATHVIDPEAEDAVEAVYALGGDDGGVQGKGADFVFEAAASIEATQQAWQMTRAGGDLVLSSVPHDVMGNLEFPAVTFAVWSKTVHSSQFGNFNIRRDIPYVAGLVEGGQLDIACLLQGEYKLDGLKQGVADVGAHKVLGATLVL